MLGSLVASLPWGARRAVFDRLTREFGTFQTLMELGDALHVENLQICGENGTFLGPLHDSGILGRYALEGSWSIDAVRMFQDLFGRTGGTYLDIGANIGLTLVPVARNPRVHCHGFEPSPRNVMYLKHNVRDGCRHDNVTIHNLALFDKKGHLPMELSPFNCGDNRLRNGSQTVDGGPLISVPVERLDDVIDLHGLSLPLAVKIDTQGAEPGVFAGGQKVLSASSLVSLEFWPFGMKQLGLDARQQIAFIESTWREGALATGDSSKRGAWVPIEEVVRQLRDHWESSDSANKYWDVMLRK